MGEVDGGVVRLSTYAEGREAFRHRELRQALYDEGRALMDAVIVNLHGPAHTARRRLENRLFRRDTFAYWEREVVPRTIDQMLAPHLAEGWVDLIPLARKTMMSLAAEIAGVDYDPADPARFEDLYTLMTRLARASTVVHATGDKQAIVDDGNEAMREFDERFYQASLARRRRIVAEVLAGDRPEDDLPRDVLTTLLLNQDRLDLPDDVVRREIAYFPWVGSHSTSNALVHAADELFRYDAAHPGTRAALRDDPLRLQRFVHEALRLHPASPESVRIAETDVELRGRHIPADSTVVVELVRANRDPSVFGPDADVFDPDRVLPLDVTPWGLTFGTGFHACLGQELAAGLAPSDDSPAEGHLYGVIVVMLGVLLRHGAAVDPDRPPEPDRASRRPNFASYPVLLEA